MQVLHVISFFRKLRCMRFRDYFQSLTAKEKKDFADEVGVSLGYCYRLKGGFATPGLKLATKIQRASKDSVRLEDWVDWREQQVQAI